MKLLTKKLLLSVTFVSLGFIVSACQAPGTSSKPYEGLSLAIPEKKEIAMKLVSSAENSSLDWQAQYAYLEDINDERGYTGGIIGFCSGTGDMLLLVRHYTETKPDNPLAPFIPALEAVNGTDSHVGLGEAFEQAWQEAATDPDFKEAQNQLRDEMYFTPAVTLAQKDGLSPLGQFIYYDAMVVHGPDESQTPNPESFQGIRAAALAKTKSVAQGGEEVPYLRAFLTERTKVMKLEAAHDDLSRLDTQADFIQAENFKLELPLTWHMYGDPFELSN